MMSPTSEERREVAERLRKTKAECDERDYPWMVEDLLQAIGFERYEDGEDGIFDRLADLIYPTCSMACRGSFTAHHDFTRWECSECGVYAFVPEKVFAPRFCPHCGARVVSE